MNEVKVTFNIWVPATFLSLVCLIGLVLSYSYYVKALDYNLKRFTVLAAEMQRGCANPNNSLATIQIGFDKSQVWSCTPFFKQRTAPKVPDGKKVVRR